MKIVNSDISDRSLANTKRQALIFILFCFIFFFFVFSVFLHIDKEGFEAKVSHAILLIQASMERLY